MDELLLKDEALRQGEVVARGPVNPAEADRLYRQEPVPALSVEESIEDRAHDLNGAEVDDAAANFGGTGQHPTSRVELDPVLANMDGMSAPEDATTQAGTAGSDAYAGGGIGGRRIPVEASAFNPSLHTQSDDPTGFGDPRTTLGASGQGAFSPDLSATETASQIAYREAPAASVVEPPLDHNANVVERTDANPNDELDLPTRESAPTVTAPVPPTGPETARVLAAGQLFHEHHLESFRASWDRVQTSFVDEPRQAVRHADALVAEVVNRITEQFSAQRGELEKQWEKGGEVSTEDLRQALKRYRLLFERLLSM